MKVELWQAAAPVLAALMLAAWAAIPKIKTASAESRKTDLEAMNESYRLVIDQLREQINWQAGEVAALRTQVVHLTGLIGSRDQEVGSLRSENAQLRAELAQLRGDVRQRRVSDT